MPQCSPVRKEDHMKISQNSCSANACVVEMRSILIYWFRTKVLLQLEKAEVNKNVGSDEAAAYR